MWKKVFTEMRVWWGWGGGGGVERGSMVDREKLSQHGVKT